MTLIHRFIRWINSRSFVIRRRSISSVSPSIPVSSNSTYKSECSSAWFSNSNSSSKQVHFADDCGEALEYVHEIPVQDNPGKSFYESLEEVYMDERGHVTAFLNVANLKPGQKPEVKFTTNEWKTHTTVPAQYRVNQKPTKRIGKRKLETKETGDEWCDTSHEDMCTYVFYFYVGKMKANQTKLVVISTLDGARDPRHDKSYSLHYPQRNVRQKGRNFK